MGVNADDNIEIVLAFVLPAVVVEWRGGKIPDPKSVPPRELIVPTPQKGKRGRIQEG